LIFDRFSKKSPNIKFHQNPSSGSRVVPFGYPDRWKNMMKLTVAFCNFANAPKNDEIYIQCEKDVKHHFVNSSNEVPKPTTMDCSCYLMQQLMLISQAIVLVTLYSALIPPPLPLSYISSICGLTFAHSSTYQIFCHSNVLYHIIWFILMP
jgi:hypothetical protein